MINFDNSDDADEQCSMVIVTLKNGALASQGSMQGIYQISDRINGKPSWTSVSNAIPSWTSVSNAIWYSLNFGWLIGTQDNIGGDICRIYGADDYGGLDDTNNQWNYYDGSDWVLATPNEININCTGKNLFAMHFCIKCGNVSFSN